MNRSSANRSPLPSADRRGAVSDVGETGRGRQSGVSLIEYTVLVVLIAVVVVVTAVVLWQQTRPCDPMAATGSTTTRC